MTFTDVKNFLKQLDYATYMTMLCTFQKDGFFNHVDQIESAQKIQSVYGRYKGYDIILRWVKVLVKEGYLIEKEASYQLAEKFCVTEEEKDKIWRTLIKDIDEAICSKKVVKYFYENAKVVDQFLTGEKKPTWILFPEAEFTYAESLYSDLLSARYLNEKLAKHVVDSVRTCQKDVVILEVGAGIGATTKVVLQRLEDTGLDIKQYIYTDLSRFFLNYAKTKFERYPFISYQTANVDSLELGEINNHHEVDLIIAVGVLNNCKNMDITLQALHGLLNPEGVLLVIESTVEFSAMLISQAFMMEKTTDTREKEKVTFLNFNQWKRYFESNHFEIVDMEPKDRAVELLGQKLFVLKRRDTNS